MSDALKTFGYFIQIAQNGSRFLRGKLFYLLRFSARSTANRVGDDIPNNLNIRRKVYELCIFAPEEYFQPD